jgi:maltose 6'-phosphate phosphatase
MKIKSSALVLLVVLGLALVGMSSPPKAIASPTVFTTLTINLLFSEITDRTLRLETIADFVKNQAEPIDVIFLQEVVSGSLVGTKSSARDLNNALAARGLTYYLSSRIEEGLPGIFTEGIAILSRHKIVFSLSHTLPFVEIVNFNGLNIPLRRIVLMDRIDIADYGKTDIYNTHLCSECSANAVDLSPFVSPLAVTTF